MTAAVFVDTNVFVHAYDGRDPRTKATAETLTRELWIEQRGRTGMQVLSEYDPTLTRKLKPAASAEEAWEMIDALLTREPQAIDRRLLIQAREVERHYRSSSWDSMIVAAQLQNSQLLMTEDLPHGLVCDTVTIRNPSLAGVAEDVGRYNVEPRPLFRHSARGRPRSARSSTVHRS